MTVAVRQRNAQVSDRLVVLDIEVKINYRPMDGESA